MLRWKDLVNRIHRLQRIKQNTRFSHSGPSSQAIRQEFLDFFTKKHDHTFVPSSSVVPYGDPSLSFVNAGMNQFKQIFLGQTVSQHKRAANSQKCIRVGGKHNDLDDVGRDGYHHTFFEMLGSWSFNDYFKAEACSMAWDLLTKYYKIPKNLLYITYFSGETNLCLPADEECKHIWLSLGVPSDHILPFGMKENFWEMGIVGPCGPCSEIHVNKNGLDPNLARRLVNQGTEDVIEIWNLVFMQYNRISGDVLEKLPAHHVDTGMGLERLVAFLQNKKSNYDTDLFMPLINAIHHISGSEPYRSNYEMNTVQGQRDCAYRLLADHSRMITIALADGAFPDSNHRLRRVIRQAIVAGRKWFNRDVTLLLELSQRVCEMFGQVYPEIVRNSNNVNTLLRFEDEIFREHLSKSGRDWTNIVKRLPELSVLPLDQQPGIVAGMRELEDWVRAHDASIPGQLAFRLYNTYGLQEDSMQLLSRIKGWTIDWGTFNSLLKEARMNTLLHYAAPVGAAKFLCQNLSVQPTETVCQESYIRLPDGSYEFTPLDAKVLALVNENGDLAQEAKAGDQIAIVSDKTCFYYEAGGQVSDAGSIVTSSGFAELLDVRRMGEYIYHIVKVIKGSVHIDQPIRMQLDETRRVETMANHTASHLFQAAVKSVLGVTCQKSSYVTPEYLRFSFGFFQSDLNAELISEIESKVRNWIHEALPVDRIVLPLQQAVSLNGITLLPGECYPDVVSVIRVSNQNGDNSFVSLEPCCGTHVRNTADLQEFSIVSVRSPGVGSRIVKAVTRSAAFEAYNRAKDFDIELIKLEQAACEACSSSSIPQLLQANDSLKSLKIVHGEATIPVVMSRQFLVRLDKVESALRAAAQDVLARTMRTQVESAITSSPSQPFIVTALSITPEILEIGEAKLRLMRATRHCPDKPIFVFAWNGQQVVGRCTVPKSALTRDFDADKWSRHIIDSLNGTRNCPKGQDPRLTYNLSVNVNKVNQNRELIQDRAISLAIEFGKSRLI